MSNTAQQYKNKKIKNTRPKIPLETGNRFDLSRGTTQLAFVKTPLVRLQQAFCLYAASTENPISETPFQVFGSEGMGLMKLPAAGISPSPTLFVRRVRPSSSQPFVLYEIIGILSAFAPFVNRQFHNYAAKSSNSKRYAVTTLAAFCRPRRWIASSRILYFMILPAAFIGKESTTATYFGTLCLAMLART